MASTDAPVLDLYAPLAYKAVFTESRAHLAPTWVPDSHQRRLTAYKVLKALEANASRHYLPSGVPVAIRDALREYGDAALLVNAVRAGVLGDEPALVVDGADVDLPDEPDLPPPPEEPESDGTPASAARARVYASQQARWAQDVDEAITEWERLWSELPGLQERQRWLRDWADKEGLWGKIHEGEGDAVTLGDGVYTLAWSAKKKRPVLRVYDPGFYFPVLDEKAADEGFPRTVHLAWEFTRLDDAGRPQQLVRRLTWELVDAAPYDVPWSDEQATETCLFSDGTWATKDVRNDLADLSDSAATWEKTEDDAEAYKLDLKVDFLPVVHVANTPASREHFGASALLMVAQLLDDLSSTDTDVRKAAELAAGPMVAVFGARGGDPLTVRPGTVFEVEDPNGRMDVLDLTGSIPELRNVVVSLLDRLSVNARVPGAALGRIDPGQAPSGVALALLFSPFGQLIGELRTPRGPTYSLLLKFVQRLAMRAGALEAGPIPTARIAFGSFLPTDRAALVNEVARLLEAGAISTQTAVTTRVAGGFAVEDARGEVDRIRLDRPDAAVKIADATGSEALAAEHLGLDLPEQPAAAAPQISLPGAGTGTDATA